jgi:uncharacterized tellurite resistance protein B-like protein
MEINELYLKTAFCCMACDGDIANEELELVKQYASNSELFKGLEIEEKLNEYVSNINNEGQNFLYSFVKDIATADLSETEELDVAKVAIQMIEADNKIEYSEISFFKKIRAKLSVSDDKLIELFKEETLFDKFPEVEPEDFILPDIVSNYDMNWNVSFKNIELKM